MNKNDFSIEIEEDKGFENQPKKNKNSLFLNFKKKQENSKRFSEQIRWQIIGALRIEKSGLEIAEEFSINRTQVSRIW